MSAQEPTMSEQKPYLLRAIYEWLVDNGCTPHLLIAYPNKGWVSGVPERFLEEEQLVLNISPSASPDCVIDNDAVYFTTRFSGQPHRVSVAMKAVAGIFARENHQYGSFFELSPEVEQGLQAPLGSAGKSAEEKPKSTGKSYLKIVK